MKTKIEPIKIVKNLDFADCVHQDFWLYREDNEFSISSHDFLDRLIGLLENLNDAIICVCTEQFNSPKISYLLFEAAKRNNRIYILVNELDESLKELASATIIRYGINCIGSFVLINPNSRNATGLFFTGGIAEGAIQNKFALSLDLDENQIKTLFTSFIYNFWNLSKYEVLEPNDWKTNKKIKQAPVDVFPSHSNFCDKAFVLKAISESSQLTYLVCNKINEKSIASFGEIEKETRIITKIRTETSSLKKLASNGNSVFGLKDEFPFILLLATEGGWLVPNNSIRKDCLFYALELNENQRKDLSEFCERLIKYSDYELKSEMKRKDLMDRKLKYSYDVSTEVIILKESNQNLSNNTKTNLLPKEDLENDPYPEKLKDDEKSVRINYTWYNSPFLLPKGANVDNLYNYWEKEEEKVKKYIDGLIAKIERLKENKESAYDSFKNFFLGKNKSLNRNKEALSEIKLLDFKNLAEVDLKTKLDALNKLASQLFDDEKQIDYQKKKSEKEEKIKNLELEWNLLKKALDEFEAIETEKLEHLKQKRQASEKVFREKYTIEDAIPLESKRGELNVILNSQKKKYNEEYLLNAQNQFDELEEVLKIKHKEEQKKYEKELKNKENKLKNKKGQINLLIKEMESLDKPKEKPKSSLDNLKQNNKKKSKFDTVEEVKLFKIQGLKQLPQIGALFKKGNQKYLAIEYWEDYDAGMQEATRLDAKLCAHKEEKNGRN